MANYTWNIKTWVRQYLPSFLRKPKRIGILLALLAPIRQVSGSAPTTLYGQFLEFKNNAELRSRYTCQHGSLQALLNKIFDPYLKRIYLETASDKMITIYGRRTQDTLVTTTYGRLTADTLVAPIYGHVEADYVTHFDGYINVPSALMMREDEIKKWTDATINLGRTYKINYY